MRAELLKLAGLPAAWVAAALGLVIPSLLVTLNSRAVPAGTDTGFLELTVGVLGPLVLGTIAAGSEYRGGQIRTSLVCVPSRLRLLAVKAGAVTLTVAVMSALSAVLTLALAGALTGGAGPRIAGVVVYWVLGALLAYGITLLTRSGVLPLTVLIVNTTAVSFSYLLTKVTPLAAYLPDLAGARMYLHDMDTPGDLAPVTGGLVMAAWVAAVLGAAGYAFHRRDA
ncbi:ABC transporter permease [Actinoplanes sp. ATCC 53533]|uniref:ABC transporter permease n=1 Tax=Actinoplanes sp. ATCC 53533 TaxID=1288362 RepID=UPI000F768D61|nr:ABC transporter permease [Actinoplanes sp. ATCC 53533]RSM65448.1 ABC transporter permease [Actinoplanes sp. ATCC 53533]